MQQGILSYFAPDRRRPGPVRFLPVSGRQACFEVGFAPKRDRRQSSGTAAMPKTSEQLFAYLEDLADG